MALKRHMLYVHFGIASMRQFQREPTTYYFTENKEDNYLEIYIFQVSCPLIPVTLLQIVYIFMTAISPNSSSLTASLLTY